MQSVWPVADRVALLDERRRAGRRGAVEGADHRRLDPDHAGIDRRRGRRGARSARPPRRPATARRRDEALGRLGRPPDGDPQPGVLDRHLADARLLDDADDLADPLGARSRRRRRPRSDSSRSPRPRIVAQERLGLVAEEREQEQLLLARGEPLVALAELVEVGLVLGLRRPSETSVDRPLRRSASIAPGGVPKRPREQRRAARRRRSGSARPRARARAPARRGSGRSARRAAASRPRRGSARARRAPRRAGRRRRARAGARRAPRRARREGCARRRGSAIRGASGVDRLVADVLVDEVGGPPERVDVDAGRRGRARRARSRAPRPRRGGGRARPGRRRRRSGRRRRARPRSRRRARCRRRPGSRARPEGRSPRAIASTSSRTRCGSSEPGRVVDEDARGAELGQPLRLLDERARSRRTGPGCRRAPRRTRARRR